MSAECDEMPGRRNALSTRGNEVPGGDYVLSGDGDALPAGGNQVPEF